MSEKQGLCKIVKDISLTKRSRPVVLSLTGWLLLKYRGPGPSLVSYNKGRHHTKEEKACEDDLGAGEPSAEVR